MGIKNKIKNFITDISNFGIEVALYIMLKKIFCKNYNKVSNYFLRKKHNVILKYLKKKYKYLIYEYNQKDYSDIYTKNISLPIWSFWWQGEIDAPEINQICFKSIKKFSNGHPVIIISKDNIKDYIEIPNVIMNKFEKGIISITHFSDIVRFELLNKYGGLWIDASVYLSNRIQKDILDNKFFTIKINELNTQCISKGRWVIGIIAGRANNILLDFLNKFQYEYWMNENKLIDYFLCDYMIQIALEEINCVKDLLENFSVENNHIFDMRVHLNDEFNKNVYNSYIENTYIHSLQRKNKYVKFKNGNITNYGYIYNCLLKNNIENIN